MNGSSLFSMTKSDSSKYSSGEKDNEQTETAHLPQISTDGKDHFKSAELTSNADELDYYKNYNKKN